MFPTIIFRIELYSKSERVITQKATMKITWTCATFTIAILLQRLETPLAFGLVSTEI